MRLCTFRRLLCLLAFAVASTAFAQVTITFNYTPSSTQYGLTASQPATWVWTLSSNSLAGMSQGLNWGSNLTWEQSGTSTNHMWSNFAGTGFGGTFDTSPLSMTFVIVANNGMVYLRASAPSGTSLGLTFNGSAVSSVLMYAKLAGFTPPMTSPLPVASTYLTSQQGTYSVTDTSGTILRLSLVGSSDLDLPVGGLNSVTIGTVAIPEPSTYAALAGLGALGLVAWHRRRAAA